MANRYRNLIYSTAEYTHTYRGFRGVELNASGSTSSTARLAYSQNMYKDYDGDGAEVLESVPGYRCFAHHKKPIRALYYQRSPFGGEDHVIAHVDDRLVRHPVSDTGKKSAVGEEIATVCPTRSFGFEYGRHFYVMDSERILEISDDGGVATVGEDGALPYVPTRYVGGEEYEQRNLLTDSFKEEFYIAEPSAYLFATEGLKFAITDPTLRYCSLVGADKLTDSEIYVPSYVSVSGISYKVMSVGESAFKGNKTISAVYMSDGITVIGKSAFAECTSLHTVVTPSTVMTIGDHAFYSCSSLTTLYLGASLSTLGSEVIVGCPITATDYELTESDLKKVYGYEIVHTRGVKYNSRYTAIRVAVPIHEKAREISSVKVGEGEAEWSIIEKDGKAVGVAIDFESPQDATDVKVTVFGILEPLDKDWAADMTSLADATPFEAVVNCRVAEVFDGRIFFAGNPSFPNTVFYTERPKSGQDSSLYVGRYNYLSDGVGSYKVRSMLAVRDMLAVFKEGDDGSGSIFYHTKSAGSGVIDTIYPVAYVHSGICSSGTCLSFLDDPVFLTSEGLMALNHENINYQRNVVCRSHNVNHSLLKEDLSTVSLCEWLGYLAVGARGKIFLADSRSVFKHPTGASEYEWFLLTDIGAYNGDHRVYRYSSDPYADAAVHPTRVGEEADMNAVYTKNDEQGNLYSFVYENGTKYRVVLTWERSGGEFYPATVFTSYNKRLFFATDDGHICVFNNDMRGVAPDSVRSDPDFDEDEYRRLMGDKIHPTYYSFVDHAPTYVMKTALDDCGIPHLTKSTVKKSLVIKAKSTSPNAIRCEVRSDERDPTYVDSFPSARTDFASFSFDESPWYVGRYGAVALPENEKRWIEKQITLSSKCYESPIAVYSVSYRYTIKGKIKNNA